jgi:hypothetical protein
MSVTHFARCLTFVVTSASLFTSMVAHADLAACIASSEQAISLRRAGKLGDARKQLAACTTASCPEEVRSDCVRRMGLVNAAIPSLVVGAKDGQGNDILRADVVIDGTKVASTLDGRPIELDPGEHVVRVDAPGLPSSGRKLVLAEGEKARREVFMLGEIEAPPAPAAPAPPPPESHGWSTGRKVAITSGVVGLVSLGIGATFGGLAASEWSSAQTDSKAAQATCTTATSSCAPQTSAQSEHSTAQTEATVSTALLGVGAALVATGVLTWFLSPASASSSEGQHAPRAAVVPTLAPGAAGLTAVGLF